MDLIDRQAVLSGFDVCKVTEYDEAGFSMNYKAVSVEAIQKAPAIDPASLRPKGEWKRMTVYEKEHICSECGDIWPDYKSNFCPNCGADMRGENDGRTLD